MKKVLIVDEHELFRLALIRVLGDHPEFEVVGQCINSKELEEQLAVLKPDVIITDIKFSRADGRDVIQCISDLSPQSKVLVLTSTIDDSDVCGAILQGVNGYLLKQVGAKDLVKAVDKVSKGESVLDPAVTGIVMRNMKNLSNPDPVDELTGQEKKILLLLADGKTNRQIGSTISLSENTVKNYISAIFDKCGFHNRAEAAAFAVKNLVR